MKAGDLDSNTNLNEWTSLRNLNSLTGKLSEKKIITQEPTVLYTGEAEKDTNLLIAQHVEATTATTEIAPIGTMQWKKNSTKKGRKKTSFYYRKKKLRELRKFQLKLNTQ